MNGQLPDDLFGGPLSTKQKQIRGKAKLPPILTDEQERLADDPNDVVCGLADPGSGKTEVSLVRGSRQAKLHGYSPRQILFLAFGTKAAKELGERLPIHYAPDEMPEVQTYHAFCLALVKRFYEEAGFKTQPGTAAEAQSNAILRKILRPIVQHYKLEADDCPLYDVARQIQAWKQEAIASETLLRRLRARDDGPQAPPESLTTAAKVLNTKAVTYHRYQKALREQNLIDFGDMLLLASEILQIDHVARSVASRFRHLVIDEYQDTDELQALIVRLIFDAAKQMQLTVIGDPQQAIYGFRGARSSNLTRIKDLYPTVNVHVLTINFRSYEEIVRISNLIAEEAHGAAHMPMRSSRGPAPADAKPILTIHADESQQARTIAIEIAQAIKRGVPEQEILVAIRSHVNGRLIGDELARNKIAYEHVGGTAFWDQPIVAAMLNYIRALKNDTAALRQVINMPYRSVPLDLVSEVWEALPPGVSCAEALRRLRAVLPPRSTPGDKIERLAEALHAAHAMASSLVSPGKVMRYLIETTGLANAPKSPGKAQEDQAESFDELCKAADEHPSVIALLEHVEAIRHAAKSHRAVKLATVHTVKGTEARLVIVPNMHDGVMPHKNARSPAEMLEEANIAFVAVSRARDELSMHAINLPTPLFGRKLDRLMDYVRVDPATRQILEQRGLLTLPGADQDPPDEQAPAAPAGAGPAEPPETTSPKAVPPPGHQPPVLVRHPSYSRPARPHTRTI